MNSNFYKENNDQNLYRNKNLESKINNNVNDLTMLNSYCIDDKKSTEIDDAISIEHKNGKLWVWIHISDVAKYINLDTDQDLNARRVGTTLYLPSRTVTMFPEDIIRSKLSLSVAKDNYAISVGVVLNEEGKIIDQYLCESIINVKYQLDYQEADDLIEYCPPEETDLYLLYNELNKRRNYRYKNGAFDYNVVEGRLYYKKDDIVLKLIEFTPSRLMISEAMVLMGSVIAEMCKKIELAVPYRIQGKQSSYAKYDSINSDEIKKKYLLKYGLSKATYSTIPSKHCSLGLQQYVQFTSPIRRYHDLIAHYQIKRFIQGDKPLSKDQVESLLQILRQNLDSSNHIVRTEINKIRIEWLKKRSNDKLQALFIKWVSSSNKIAIIRVQELSMDLFCELLTTRNLECLTEILIRYVASSSESQIKFIQIQ